MTENSVLVVAFDGADKKVMEEMELENIKQEEFGSIDNSEGIFKRSTTELFVSFITGKKFQDHGVRGIGRWNNRIIDNFENYSENYWALRKFSGLRKNFYENFTPFKRTGYGKNFYEQETLFEKIEASECLWVPGYDFTLQNGGYALKEHGLEAAIKQQNAVNDYKQNRLLDVIKKDNNFVMAHFHKIDHFHHWFWEVGNEEKAWEAYREADKYGGAVKEKALKNGFDYVIFMSDHGLPTEAQHNENAFYSCNRELFGDQTPHITDFHDKILELVGESEESTSEKPDEDGYSKEEEEEVKSRLEDLGYM